MKAILSNYRQAPRKTRLLADLVRGKKVGDALVVLEHTDKRATRAFAKLIESAVRNAVYNDKVAKDSLVIKKITVDEGRTLHRIRPVARGSAHPIRKRTSHIALELGIQEKSEARNTKSKTKAKKKVTSKDKI